jgi:glucan phosphorylase
MSRQANLAIFHAAKDPALAGRIAFLEDYDMHVARYLLQGVDLWLNTPLPPMEASGTSGMKAALNGVPSLSILDGWWLEGYDGTNGWAIGSADPDGGAADAGDARDARDAESLYRTLEERVVPLFYARSREGIPHGWLQVVRSAIRSIGPGCARRMVKEYGAPLPGALQDGRARSTSREGNAASALSDFHVEFTDLITTPPVLLEAALSIDNADIAVLINPSATTKKAQYGIIGAFAFRIVAALL